MKIKNRKQFIKTILIIVGIILFINLLLPDKSYSHKGVEYKNITVLRGDTLWTIAKDEQKNNSYYEGKDIRDIIQDIKKTNNLNSANIKINQTLKISTY